MHRPVSTPPPEPVRAAMWASLEAAPTLLENHFWGALLGVTSWQTYFDELSITTLEGPGGEPDDFEGIP